MRGSRGVFLGFVVLAFASLPLFAWAPIDEMIASLNVLLADHSFTDHSGQQAQTSIAIEDGILVVQTAKHDGAEVVIASRASVMMELRAMTNGVMNEWVLPEAHAVVVQFESNPEAALEVRDRMSDLIHAVQSPLKVVS
jgi:hypothetical protein